jgi:hypothetical protein
MPSTKPPLELDVEVESADGALYRWDPTSKLAAKRPQGLNFSTQRGEGFGPGGAILTRQVMRDYPDLDLLNTIRFIGKNGEVAYEGLIHDFARANDPIQQFAVTSVGWMATARFRKFREIYVDRSLASWSAMSTSRRAAVYADGYNADAASMSAGPDDAGRPSLTSSATGKIQKPWFEFTYDGLGARVAILYLGGISRINLLDHGADGWVHLYPFGAADLAHGLEVLGADVSASSSLNCSIPALPAFTGPSGSAQPVVGLTGYYGNPTAVGSEGAQYGFRIERPAAFGPHGLTLYGSAPEHGPVVSDMLAHIFNNFTPLTWDEDNTATTYPVQQARFNGDYPLDAAKTLNDLHLFELAVFADKKVTYRPADLTTYDWQVRTDDPGVRFNPLQGDSIDGFANGVEVTYTDFTGRTVTLYPDDFAELRDETETNPANRRGISLWKDFTVPYPTTLEDALQMGRAYLAEYNRPKSPGTITIAGGYIMDGAGHWRQGWAPKCGETIALTNHPNDAPRLITSTPTWDQDSKLLTISIDNGYQLLQAFLAREAIAREAANL